MLSLSIRKLCTHSQSSYGVYTLQAHVGFKIFKFSREIIFFILTLSTHVSGFTLHTVIWFTLSKHMLGSTFSNFHRSFFCYTYTLHTCFRIHSPYSYLVYTLQAHVRFKIFKFSPEIIFSCLHSPYSYLVYTLQAHVRFKIFEFLQKLNFFILTFSTHVSGFTLHRPYSYLVYTLQAHVGFKIFKVSREIIFSCLHSPNMFQGSLSIQLFGLHSPSTR